MFTLMRSWLRRCVATVKANLTLIFSIVGVIISTIAATYASLGFYQKREQYESEKFSRAQGQLTLAWHTISEANGKKYEIGQSDSLRYIASQVDWNSFDLHITLNNSVVNLSSTAKTQYLWLSHSSLCGTKISNTNAQVYLSYSFLIRTEFIGDLNYAEFIGSDLQNSLFTNVVAKRGNFMAANMDEAKMKGGAFRYANFTGASMRKLITQRGVRGFGSPDYDVLYSSDYSLANDDDPWEPVFGKDSADEVLVRYGLKDDPRSDSFLVDFSGATFTAADLRGAHLENSTITQLQADQACTDQTTILPRTLSDRRACNNNAEVERKRAGFQAGAYKDGAKQCEAGFMADSDFGYIDTFGNQSGLPRRLQGPLNRVKTR
jgi:uncharacterized protein YjbI with pentapeptide repeats